MLIPNYQKRFITVNCIIVCTCNLYSLVNTPSMSYIDGITRHHCFVYGCHAFNIKISCNSSLIVFSIFAYDYSPLEVTLNEFLLLK